MVKNKALPDLAAHPQSGFSLSLSLILFILRVPLDPAEAGPRQFFILKATHIVG